MKEKLIVTLPTYSPSPVYGKPETNSIADGSIPIMFGFLIIFSSAITIYALMPKRAQQHSFNLKCSPSVPCQHCRYFSHNSYLQCSVHPTTVMTKEALDCQDYSPNSQE